MIGLHAAPSRSGPMTASDPLGLWPEPPRKFALIRRHKTSRSIVGAACDRSSGDATSWCSRPPSRLIWYFALRTGSRGRCRWRAWRKASRLRHKLLKAIGKARGGRLASAVSSSVRALDGTGSGGRRGDVTRGARAPPRHVRRDKRAGDGDYRQGQAQNCPWLFTTFTP